MFLDLGMEVNEWKVKWSGIGQEKIMNGTDNDLGCN